ncbi:MAG TPA: hypothetical protein VIO38_16950, partial [Rariglobus sp.]
MSDKKKRIMTFTGRGSDEQLESAAAVPGLDPEDLAELSRALQVLEAETVHGRGDGVMNAAEDETASLLQTFFTEVAPEESPNILQPTETQKLEAKMDERDILGWAGSFFTWAKGLKKHAFIDDPGPVTRIPNHTRCALFGDWGSGLYGAPEVAKQISEADDKPNLILHLGDTYYSGTNGEVRDRLVGTWPSV